MSKLISLTATVEKSGGKGGWHYVRLTKGVCDKLKQQSGKNGNIPVLVKVGKTTWPSTTMSMGQQRWFVAINSEVRKAESIFVGDAIVLGISADQKRIMHNSVTTPQEKD